MKKYKRLSYTGSVLKVYIHPTNETVTTVSMTCTFFLFIQLYRLIQAALAIHVFSATIHFYCEVLRIEQCNSIKILASK